LLYLLYYSLYWHKNTNTDAEAEKTLEALNLLALLSLLVVQSTKLTQKLQEVLNWLALLALLVQKYKSANTDAEGAGVVRTASVLSMHYTHTHTHTYTYIYIQIYIYIYTHTHTHT
jgi:hypothetical protein